MRQAMLMIALTAGSLSGVAWSQDIEPLSAGSMPTSEVYWAELVEHRLEQPAGAMAFSSVTVVTNANRLRYFQPKGGVA